MNKEQIKTNGKGILKYSNVESVCKHGKTEDVQTVLSKATYALERTTDELDLMVRGFELLKVDLSTLSTDLKALKKVKATDDQIEKVIGAKVEQIKEYNEKSNYQSYLQNIIEKLEKAMG